MENPENGMEEIYALPPRLKYTESWLEIKERRGFAEYWTVLKGTYIFFFQDANTHVKEQYVGYIGIEVQQSKCTAKRGSKKEFTLEMGKKKFHLRANDDILRRRWIHAINLVNRADAPGPLPGDPDFQEITDSTPAPDKMKKRANTVAGSHFPTSFSQTWNDDQAFNKPNRDNLSLDLKHLSLQPTEEEKKEEEKKEESSEIYDPVFVFPSWYYEKMSRQEAEQIMSDQAPGSYLVRDSDKSKSMYALTIKDIGKMKHHRIWVSTTTGQCYFESSPNVTLPNLLQAVDSLMKNTYSYLRAQPVCVENRRSGDGEEARRQAESPRGSLRSTSENPYASPGCISPQSSFDSVKFPASPGRQISVPGPSFPEPNQGVKSRKTNSLPGYPMVSRPSPGYENHKIIERHYRSTGGESYIDMHPVTPENNNVFQDDGQPEAPPPLPVKKYSMQRQNFADHIYENVPFVYINNEFTHYQTPTPQ